MLYFLPVGDKKKSCPIKNEPEKHEKRFLILWNIGVDSNVILFTLNKDIQYHWQYHSLNHLQFF